MGQHFSRDGDERICETERCAAELRAFVQCTEKHVGQAPRPYEGEWCTEEKHVCRHTDYWWCYATRIIFLLT